ncbi:MAG TPA: hypothetical protein VGR29_03905 [Thermomicrobiales bacterium]|nr:hypothetical protein [Thermomicrobiales bacterium]
MDNRWIGWLAGAIFLIVIPWAHGITAEQIPMEPSSCMELASPASVDPGFARTVEDRSNDTEFSVVVEDQSHDEGFVPPMSPPCGATPFATPAP